MYKKSIYVYIYINNKLILTYICILCVVTERKTKMSIGCRDLTNNFRDKEEKRAMIVSPRWKSFLVKGIG